MLGSLRGRECGASYQGISRAGSDHLLVASHSDAALYTDRALKIIKLLIH